MVKKEGTQIILVNPHGQVLLYLRDDKPDILYPNMWSLLGGMLEPGETPLECIVREIAEELIDNANEIGFQLDPAKVTHLCTRDLDFGIEHTFTAAADFDIEDVTLTEGQALRWFSRDDAERTPLAYGDNAILETYFGSLTSA
ncbi:8-oxo-dGTP diphosphatase [Nocardia amikacinitolerans]|uniref:8-oxo-dGTP diphosphatase n=1 Tax=Nocardia amikacinitolerans TaxID=756689 RepID=A0A285L505_9NOCA|nr:NUDIX domain-containing protein [Nocardia amikacinitolerans]SNY79988.1 8-oxo-dGTP diphosphatase [Nocardia amikacinitolerans]